MSREKLKHSRYAIVVAVMITYFVQTSEAAAVPNKCNGMADIVFVLDSSGSIGPEDFKLLLNFTDTVTSAFPTGPNDIQFGVIVFSTDFDNVIQLNDYKTNLELKRAIQNLAYVGGITNTAPALRSVREYSFTPSNGARPNVPKIVIVITDGLSSCPSDTTTEAKLLQLSGPTVIAIGVGSGADQDELNRIASSESLVFMVDSFSVLNAIKSQLTTSVCEAQTAQLQNITSCISDSSCIGKADGNYKACSPECEEGYYYTCSHEFTYKMTCALGFYTRSNGTPYTARLVYNPDTKKCEEQVSYCPRDPQKYEVIQPKSSNPNQVKESRACLSYGQSCHGKPEGNYPKCYPECQDGFYFVCSNNETYDVPCSLGHYKTQNNVSFDARMVYDTTSDSCQLSTSSCPRTPQNPLIDNPPPGPNGTSTSVEPQKCHGKADILFVIDSSGSIGEPNYNVMKFFIADLTSYFLVGENEVQFSALIFSTDIEFLFGFSDTSSNADVKQALLAARYLQGGTSTHTALTASRVYGFSSFNGARDNTPKLAIVITDGISNYPSLTAAEADLLKQAGVTVISIGVGPGKDVNELKAIASSDSNVFEVDNFGVLGVIRNALVTSACESSNDGTAACVSNSCDGKANKNYPACNPECKEGYYYSCTGGNANKMPCGLGVYTYPNGTRFTARLVYNSATGSCDLNSTDCPRDPRDHVVVPPPESSRTINYNPTCISPQQSCRGKPDGDYPMCYPECQSGNFYSCSNGESYVMPCPLGWYKDAQNNQYTDKLIFNPDTDTCEYEVAFCPREVRRSVTPTPLRSTVTPTPLRSTVTSTPLRSTVTSTPLRSTVTSTPVRTTVTSTPTPAPSITTTEIPQCKGKADILVIFDASGSVGYRNYATQATFAANLSTYFLKGPDDVQFSALVFSDIATIVFPFNRYYEDNAVWQAFLSVPYYGFGTETASALRLARDVGFTSANGARGNSVSKLVIIMTDGISNYPIQTSLEADRLKRAGVAVIAIAIGDCVIPSELLSIASSSSSVFNVTDFDALQAIKRAVVTTSCQYASPTSSCVTDSCGNKVDGTYLACDPGCKQGYYYSCSGGITRKMSCDTRGYTDSNGNRFIAKGVYDPATESCLASSTSCPREAKDYAL